jgi:hypothetical protein
MMAEKLVKNLPAPAIGYANGPAHAGFPAAMNGLSISKNVFQRRGSAAKKVSQNSLIPSSPQKPGSKVPGNTWIPAFSGMTVHLLNIPLNRGVLKFR